MASTQQKRKLVGAAAIVMSSMVISRITGFVRDALISNLGSDKADILMTANTATNIMYNLLIGGAIAAALIPVLSSFIVRDEEEEGWKAVGTFINVTFIISIVFCIFGIIFSPQLVSVLGKGYSAEKIHETIILTRILFPSVAFFMLAGLTNGVLYSYKRFTSAAYGPAIYNIGFIISILVFRKSSMEKIAIGIMVSSLVYFLFQLSFAMKDIRYYRFKIFFTNPGFIRLVKLAIPSLLASSIVQVNAVISQSYTSNYVKGSVTAFLNANNIWQLPYGIFAMGLGSAILPTLSEKLALGHVKEFKELLNKSLKNILLLIVPSAIAFIIIGKPIVSAIYKWSSAFGADRINLTSHVLLFFSLALFSQSILAIIGRAYYASNDTFTPLILGGSSIILNGLACYIFFKTTNLQAGGMSLASSISSTFYMITMIYILNKRIKGLLLKDLFKFFFKTAIAAILMGVVLFLLNILLPIDFATQFSMKTKIIELGILAAEVLLAAVTYFSIILIMKVPEGEYLFNILKNRLKTIAVKLKK